MTEDKPLSFWLPAFIGMVCQGLGIGLIAIYGFFQIPLSDTFEVGAATINIGPVFLLIVPAFIGPLIGRFVDKIAIRYILMLGVLIAMLSLYGISLSETLFQATLGFIGFSIGLSMYGPISINAMLIKIYKHRSGRALAISAMGVSIATILLPPIIAWLMSSYDWRESLVFLSTGIFFVLSGCVLLGVPLTNDSLEDSIAEGKNKRV